MFLMDSLIRRCACRYPAGTRNSSTGGRNGSGGISKGIAAGRIVIPANPKRMHQQCAIGEGCQVKINVNIGTSGTRCDPELEEEKAKAALQQWRRRAYGSLHGRRSCRDPEKNSCV